MISWHNLILFVLATLTLNLIPGPDMIYIMAHTVSGNKLSGFLSTLGVSVGLLCHTLIAASGLALIILHSALAFTALKFLGATYLIVMGIRMIIYASSKVEITSQNTHMKNSKCFLQGILTNLLNPKILIFFIAFLPQFIQTTKSNVFSQMLTLSIIFIILGTIVNSLVVILVDKIRKTFVNENFKAIQQRLAGAVLIAIGLKIAL